MKAIAILAGELSVRGLVYFEQASPLALTNISWEIVGSEANSLKGFHVHQFGDETKGCISAGSHFNPKGTHHGAPEDLDRHFGDLGNIAINEDGASKGWVCDPYLTLFGENSILGRSVVIHNGTDDLGKGGNAESLKTGNAGARAACGIIGYSSTP